ncbi:flap endonuclease GEN homolog 1-like isoform X1 [Octopus sinensis]|uniref:Flap endonuclease GEN homolog 1-like isoform X1 n=1 Tax=Octopus sinensis TaxID=2607531 RepID=A0A7E6F2Q6_9MOLL|nr:flap endonuclease GEN homolog 1-like isoform X1 [Octopus sinensis]
MGVPSLWRILQPVKKEVYLSELSGYKIAIDLNTWIVECKLCTAYKNIYLRNVFLRTIEFLINGIEPIFVIDGRIPELKDSTVHKRRKISYNQECIPPIRRERSRSITSQKCLTLLKYLGATCFTSNGEAEALCAQLNAEEVVDACFSSDSDILLYGAQKVYRNYSKINKQCLLESISAKDVFNKFGLEQRSLICLALLIGCDYDSQGVKGIGSKYALMLLEELKLKNVDALERILCWRSNAELQTLAKTKEEFIKSRHCQQCMHKVHHHSKIGCKKCRMKKVATKNCVCFCHETVQKLKLHEMELIVREKALLNPDFPSEKIIAEFLDSKQIYDAKENITWKEPDIENLCKFIVENLFWSAENFFLTMVPLLIYWKLNSYPYRFLDDLKPQRILQKCKRNHQHVYEVEWSKIKENWTKLKVYTSFVDIKKFTACFPTMAEKFEESISAVAEQKAAED